MKEALQISELGFDGLLAREWVTTNSLGGFASSSICGLNTRRYHGLLVASMTPPVRRMVLLSRLEETVRCDGHDYHLACNEYPGTIWPRGHELLRAFSVEPYPRWAYQADGWTLQKEVRLLRGQNTVLVSYTLLGGGHGIDLEIRPLFALRGMHELSFQWNGKLDLVAREKGHWQIPATRRTPEVFFAHDGNFESRAHWYLNQIYRRELEYGYAGLEDLWSPGVSHCRIMPGQTIHFACSADPFTLSQVIEKAAKQASEADVRFEPSRTLVAGAAIPATAELETDRAALSRAAAGHLLATSNGEAYGAVAQYHWSPPSIRAALVGFNGLALATGQLTHARSLLAALVGRLKNGLLPTDLPTDGSEPNSFAADVSLWYIHAVRQYLLYSGDDLVVRRQFFPAVMAIVDSYRRGTDCGVKVDAEGLLCCGTPRIAATWMDNLIGDQPVTSRHGRPVEINALWYNALMSAADLCRRFDRPADAEHLESLAARAKHAFNLRFWNERQQCCFDVVGDGGNDAAVRPNQLFAVSLPFAVLQTDRWAAVVAKARKELLTPMGVRTLTPSDSRYIGRYAGNLLHRDCAAHNGSAFPWLIGAFVTATLRAGAEGGMARAEAIAAIAGCMAFLKGDGLGHLFELCDGDAPHACGGAVASPLSIGELLRCLSEDLMGRVPKGPTRAAPAASAAGK